jgi:hypothetical protein
MKIRTKNELKDILDKDLAWRKVELSTILANVNSSEAGAIKVALRTSILLLYAHWEGFIKKAAEAYLNFVSHQSLRFIDLDNCFLAIALRQKLRDFKDENDSTIHSQFVSFVRERMQDDARISYDNVISARSNLNSKILRQILTSIGINYSLFELKGNLIDQQLLKYRNTIAHGEYLMLDKIEYKAIHSEIFAMINEIKNRIENAVYLEEYKKVNKI